MAAIDAAIERLSKTHPEHISQYGTGNELRLTGKHETCDMNTFRSELSLLPCQPALHVAGQDHGRVSLDAVCLPRMCRVAHKVCTHAWCISTRQIWRVYGEHNLKQYMKNMICSFLGSLS